MRNCSSIVLYTLVYNFVGEFSLHIFIGDTSVIVGDPVSMLCSANCIVIPLQPKREQHTGDLCPFQCAQAAF